VSHSGPSRAHLGSAGRVAATGAPNLQTVYPQGRLDPADRASLERWALFDWSPAAEARVRSVVVEGPLAAVNLLVHGDYEYSVIFRRDEDGARQESSGSSGHMKASDLSWIHPE
jgi:hypothetical protein